MERQELLEKLGVPVDPSNIVGKMFSSGVTWKAMTKFASDVMVKKEERERQDQLQILGGGQ